MESIEGFWDGESFRWLKLHGTNLWRPLYFSLPYGASDLNKRSRHLLGRHGGCAQAPMKPNQLLPCPPMPLSPDRRSLLSVSHCNSHSPSLHLRPWTKRKPTDPLPPTYTHILFLPLSEQLSFINISPEPQPSNDSTLIATTPTLSPTVPNYRYE